MENSNINSEALVKAFALKGNVADFTVITDGHINGTYSVEMDDCGTKTKYILQQINTYVFKDPDKLSNNIQGVTEHLRKKIAARGGNPDREALRVYPTADGKLYFRDENGFCWRCFNFIEETHTCQVIDKPDTFRNAAKAFGAFQCELADYPIGTLFDTIPDFHNTKQRIANFKASVAADKSGRAKNVVKETEFVLAREKDCSVLVDLLTEGKLPLRVTHNDTKLNNVMLDNDTNEGVCVVDLDTVMPGLSLYDFGDSIRFGANTAAEDEKDLSKVSLSLEYFEAYADGYLEAAGKALTENEITYLPFSSKLMTLECGMRFLGDYIDGDVYFKTEYPEHNLVRAHTQFALVEDMEKHMQEMNDIIAKLRIKYGI